MHTGLLESILYHFQIAFLGRPRTEMAFKRGLKINQKRLKIRVKIQKIIYQNEKIHTTVLEYGFPVHPGAKVYFFQTPMTALTGKWSEAAPYPARSILAEIIRVPLDAKT